jgi:hypothetical protein
VPVLIAIAALVFAMGDVAAFQADRIGLTPRARIAHHPPGRRGVRHRTGLRDGVLNRRSLARRALVLRLQQLRLQNARHAAGRSRPHTSSLATRHPLLGRPVVKLALAIGASRWRWRRSRGCGGKGQARRAGRAPEPLPPAPGAWHNALRCRRNHASAEGRLSEPPTITSRA